MGSSQKTLRSSVLGAVPWIHLGLVWPLYDSTRFVGSKGPGEGAAKRAMLDRTFWETSRLPARLGSFTSKSHCKMWRHCPGVGGRR